MPSAAATGSATQRTARKAVKATCEPSPSVEVCTCVIICQVEKAMTGRLT